MPPNRRAKSICRAREPRGRAIKMNHIRETNSAGRILFTLFPARPCISDISAREVSEFISSETFPLGLFSVHVRVFWPGSLRIVSSFAESLSVATTQFHQNFLKPLINMPERIQSRRLFHRQRSWIIHPINNTFPYELFTVVINHE